MLQPRGLPEVLVGFNCFSELNAVLSYKFDESDADAKPGCFFDFPHKTVNRFAPTRPGGGHCSRNSEAVGLHGSCQPWEPTRRGIQEKLRFTFGAPCLYHEGKSQRHSLVTFLGSSSKGQPVGGS